MIAPINLTERELAVCSAALQGASYVLKDGEAAAQRLGTPINFATIVDEMRALQAKIDAALAEPGKE